MTRPETTSPYPIIETMRWHGGVDGYLSLLDQTRLPGELLYVDCRSIETAWRAIRTLQVRGAPAIGIAAAYSVVLGMQSATSDAEYSHLEKRLHDSCEYLATSRPTAVNLFWALDRMRKRGADALNQSPDDPPFVIADLLKEARAIHEEDRLMCRTIGRHGARLLAGLSSVLTHCNAGGLATAEYGTALAAIFTAQDQGHTLHVYVDETRPLLQGARLTAWELMQRGIPATLICDSMAAQVMKEGRVQAVITGADRIAANGDSANKIGTYGLAVLAHAHGVPFYIAAPSSTFDLHIPNGDDIPIEQRNADEITEGFGHRTAPAGIQVYNPAFDVTPAKFIRAIITEKGIIEPVSRESILKLMAPT